MLFLLLRVTLAMVLISPFNLYAQTTIEHIRGNEGLRLQAYEDTHGFVTIGYGRNLSTRGISKAMAELMLKEDIAHCEVKLDTYYSWWRLRREGSQTVLVDMCINIGFNGLSKFQNMLRSLFNSDYKGAAAHLMDSRYARQLKGRANRNKQLILGDIL